MPQWELLRFTEITDPVNWEEGNGQLLFIGCQSQAYEAKLCLASHPLLDACNNIANTEAYERALKSCFDGIMD